MFRFIFGGCLILSLTGCEPIAARSAKAEPAAKQPDHVVAALARFEESQKADLTAIRKGTDDANASLNELKSLAKSQPVSPPDPRTADISAKLDEALSLLDRLVAKPPKIESPAVDPPPAEPPAKSEPPKLSKAEFDAALNDLKAEADRVAKETAALKAEYAPKSQPVRGVVVRGDTLPLDAFIAQWYRGNTFFDTRKGSISFHLREHGVSAADIASMDFQTQLKLHGALHERANAGGSRMTTTYSAPATASSAPAAVQTFRWVQQCANGVCQMVPQALSVETRTRTRGRR